MVILATRQKEIGSNPLKDANCNFDANGKMVFSVKIARCNWTKEMTFRKSGIYPGYRVWRDYWKGSD